MPRLLPGLIAAVSNDAVLGAGAALVCVLLGITLEGNRRWANRVERSVKDHGAAASKDIHVVAVDVVEVKTSVAEVNSRLHDARERLARLEGAAEFIIVKQTNVAAVGRATHQAVVAVAHELQTDNGQSVGQLADADEGRRVRSIAVDDRTESEQGYVTRLEDVEREDHEVNGHSPPD